MRQIVRSEVSGFIKSKSSLVIVELILNTLMMRPNFSSLVMRYI